MNIEKYGGDWGVFLDTPIDIPLKAESTVSEHRPMNTRLYVHADSLSENFVEYGGEIKWWPGAKSFQILLLAAEPVEFKDIKLEIYPAQS